MESEENTQDLPYGPTTGPPPQTTCLILQIASERSPSSLASKGPTLEELQEMLWKLQERTRLEEEIEKMVEEGVVTKEEGEVMIKNIEV